MEDRHYLSEPRPISGLDLPTWDVDILREGVDTPIMTIRVDNETLPPRRRKKKIVWKLPDALDQNPKFGQEDKKRILELFKEKKKEMKRKAKKSSITQEEEGGGGGGGENNGGQPAPLLRGVSSGMYEDVGSDGSQKQHPASPSKGPPPGFTNMSISDDTQNEEKKKLVNGNTKTTSRPSDKKGPSPTQNSATPKASPPPGRSSSTPKLPPGISSTPSQQQKQQLPPPQPPGLAPSEKSSTPPQQSQQQPPPPGIAPTPQQLRHFVVPPNSTLAQVVTETYYLLLKHELTQELASYYAPTAQKSLTVGSAHAVCLNVDQRLLQLQSLVGMVVQIKGVLQQPTVGQGTLVLITGTCVQPHALPFCHSLVLVPSSVANNGSVGFHIQNDALSFMTKDD